MNLAGTGSPSVTSSRAAAWVTCQAVFGGWVFQKQWFFPVPGEFSETHKVSFQ